MTTFWPGPAMFLDRDGTLIEEVGYLTRLDRMRLIPGAAAALRRANDAGMPVVLVTNQSAVARGMIDEEFLQGAGEHLRTLLGREGGRIDAIYYCPHHPDGRPPYDLVCDCRKPAPGMIEQACRDLGIDPRGAYMIGDKTRDIQTGAGLGLIPLLVRTGYGRDTERALPADFASRGGRVFDDLAAAVRWIFGAGESDKG